MLPKAIASLALNSLQKICGSRAVTQARLKLSLQQWGLRKEAQLQRGSGAGGTYDFKGGLADAKITTATHPTECKGDSFQPEAYRQASSVN